MKAVEDRVTKLEHWQTGSLAYARVGLFLIPLITAILVAVVNRWLLG